MQFTADERKKEDIFHGLRGFPTGSTTKLTGARPLRVRVQRLVGPSCAIAKPNTTL